ncbi:hypothetical protein [Haloarcula sp. CGMCC 1.2071]|uniref:hypothetical protein n=1 Tax=Haloarcula sp. CGMCC 1.2071 TaxID=3111454 RepID=UPI00300E72EF
MTDPDPERSEGVLDRLDARHYGDREQETPGGVAPPCSECGRRERLPDREVCSECVEECPECGGPVRFGWEDGSRVCPEGHRWEDEEVADRHLD